MKLVSPAFGNNGPIPSLYTCDAQGANPPLLIEDVPDEAKSLVLIVDDPDAPMGIFVHWLLWNIPATTKEITEDELPNQSVEGINSAGETGWIAPCPPNGMHNYRFLLSALSKTLNLPDGATRDVLEKEMEDAILEKAELVGQYQREE